MDGAERGQRSERVASDVAEYPVILVFAHHAVQRVVRVAVPAARTQRRRTRGYVFARGETGRRFQSQRLFDIVRGQLPGAGHIVAEASADTDGGRQYAAQLFLHERLSVFQYEDFVAGFGHTAHQRFRQRILGQFQYREIASCRKVLHQVVVADTAGDYARFPVRAVGIAVVG